MRPQVKKVALKKVMNYYCFVCNKAKQNFEDKCTQCGSSTTRIELKEVAYVDEKKDPRQHGPI